MGVDALVHPTAASATETIASFGGRLATVRYRMTEDDVVDCVEEAVRDIVSDALDPSDASLRVDARPTATRADYRVSE